MPNPGKPSEVKKKLGSRHYKPAEVVYALPEVAETPTPERPLLGSGRKLWERAWQLGRNWISDKSDVDLLLIVCEQLDERDALRAFVLENLEAWHERNALRIIERDITTNLSLLGFNPTARTKLGVAEVTAKSKLEELMAKKQERFN
jgi:hypothetical protein